ncbi:MAG TPA: NAD(P)/FAD-dependent oxidoreductase [Solirubrobacteraceae bacterium]|jgi:protoporphyrinogen oxidase|nr:NAD(P)/FAD-dependent oxidoreductase [Solirubrobacteraceae bacterium]
MRVAVIGAGVAGLTAAHRLSKIGHACDVYERWPGLGGQAATLDAGGGVRIERYYHHLFMTDRHIQALCRELGLPDELEWRPSSVAMFSDGRTHPFTTPLDLLRYPPLSPWSRLRMGAAVLMLQRRHRVEPFELITARAWIQRYMGREVWDKVWGPLLRAKFGERADAIAMAWLWSKLTLRRELKGAESRQELLGYPRSSFETIFAALARAIEDAGGRVLIDRPVARIERDADGFAVHAGAAGSFRRGHDPRDYESHGEPSRYDAVLATVPSEVFMQMLDERLAARMRADYKRRVRASEYHTALCLVLELERSMTHFYWTNVIDPGLPFCGLVEHTNFIEPERYGGRRFAYVANYVASDDELLELGPDELLTAYEPGLRRLNPGFSREWVRDRWLFREPHAQPIVTIGYRDRMPAIDTGIPGLVLANTTQIYPEDRGTNYSVRLGWDAAAALLSQPGLPRSGA